MAAPPWIRRALPDFSLPITSIQLNPRAQRPPSEARRQAAAEIVRLRESGKTFAEIAQELEISNSYACRLFHSTGEKDTAGRRLACAPAEAARLRAEGKSFAKIGRELSVSAATIRRTLKLFGPSDDRREEHWAILDLKGKAGHTRTIPMPSWVKCILDDWLQAANLKSGKLFRRVNKTGRAWGEGITEEAVWHVVREYAPKAGIDKLAPHDLRRTCARLCYTAGGELEQIQFVLGHVSIQTTERYLACKQRIQSAVNDRIGIEPTD